jgi:hydroxymethylpyrimidine/phosphomethylpyrimidine kinase
MRTQPNRWPIAATIAGSDSGGGAGIQADLKTFFALKVHGVSAITALTAQNPKGVFGVHPVPRRFVEMQLEAIWNELPPVAAKTGMLYSKKVVKAVADFCGQHALKNLVVDPVMVSTSGARLLSMDAVRAYKNRLFPLAKLITPNVEEAEVLLKKKIVEPEDLRSAARLLHGEFGTAVLLKGGHLKGVKQAIDIFFDGKNEILLEAPFVSGISTHGTGCTYSALITGFLAHGKSLVDSVIASKPLITQAIRNSVKAGRHDVLRQG